MRSGISSALCRLVGYMLSRASKMTCCRSMIRCGFRSLVQRKSVPGNASDTLAPGPSEKEGQPERQRGRAKKTSSRAKKPSRTRKKQAGRARTNWRPGGVRAPLGSTRPTYILGTRKHRLGRRHVLPVATQVRARVWCCGHRYIHSSVHAHPSRPLYSSSVHSTNSVHHQGPKRAAYCVAAAEADLCTRMTA